MFNGVEVTDETTFPLVATCESGDAYSCNSIVMLYLLVSGGGG